MGIKSKDVCFESWGDGTDNNDLNFYSLMDIHECNNNNYYFEGTVYWVPNMCTQLLSILR